jgi:hypothetical protein
VTADDQVFRWGADSRAFFLFDGANLPYQFERLDLTSGRRELIREVSAAAEQASSMVLEPR